MVLDWFDLNGTAAPIGPAGGVGLSPLEQVLLYLVVVAGVVLSEAVAMARSGSPVRVRLSRAWLAVACLIALVVFPAVWREIGAMHEATLLVQMGMAAQGGVFWGVVMAGAEKGLAGEASG
jgi:polyferredoxin